MDHCGWLKSCNDLINRRIVESIWPSSYLLPLSLDQGGGALAERIARRLLCRNPDQPECRTCPDCLLTLQCEHPDLITIRPDRESSTPSIKIDCLRRAIDRVSKAPTFSRYQVIYIESCELMTTQCANALLKTLEEPKPGLYLVMQANATRSLLPTILSRLFIESIHFDSKPMASYVDECLSGSPAHGFLRYTHKHQLNCLEDLVQDDRLVHLYRLVLKILLTNRWQPVSASSLFADYSASDAANAILFSLMAILSRDRGLDVHNGFSESILMHAPSSALRLSPLQIENMLQVCLEVKRKVASRIMLNANYLKSTMLIRIWRLHSV